MPDPKRTPQSHACSKPLAGLPRLDFWQGEMAGSLAGAHRTRLQCKSWADLHMPQSTIRQVKICIPVIVQGPSANNLGPGLAQSQPAASIHVPVQAFYLYSFTSSGSHKTHLMAADRMRLWTQTASLHASLCAEWTSFMCSCPGSPAVNTEALQTIVISIPFKLRQDHQQQPSARVKPAISTILSTSARFLQPLAAASGSRIIGQADLVHKDYETACRRSRVPCCMHRHHSSQMMMSGPDRIVRLPLPD